MGTIIAHMVTWTTYGTWLQGDNRGYVKNGQILPANNKLKSENLKQQRYPAVKLNAEQKQITEEAILNEAQRVGKSILALAVCSNHIHLVAQVSEESIEQAVRRYKYSATSALRNCGLWDKVWSQRFDKRFCFTEDELERRIRYVRNHNHA